jgi:hypothetical protein
MRMCGGDIKKPMASIQIRKAGEAEGMEIGETVSLTVTGVVRSIDSPREEIDYDPNGSKTRMRPGCIELEVKSMRIAEAASEDGGDE